MTVMPAHQKNPLLEHKPGLMIDGIEKARISAAIRCSNNYS